MGLDPEALFELGISQTNGDLVVQRFLDYERGLALRERGIWGVRLLPSSQRVYAEQDLAGPLIGYVGLDGSGLWGIERDFDPVLQGQPGLLLSERDALGRPIAFAASGGREPTVGGEVQLTIDRFVQAIAEQRLAEAVEANKAKGGTVIVMESQTAPSSQWPRCPPSRSRRSTSTPKTCSISRATAPSRTSTSRAPCSRR